MRDGEGNMKVIMSREGVTQGDPMDMVGYSIAMLPLTSKLSLKYPTLIHIWFADDAGLMGDFRDLKNIIKTSVT